MTKQQFVGHLFCDMRYNQLKNMIKYKSMDSVMAIYKVHQNMPNNVRYNDLQKTFQERFNKENGEQ